MSDVTATRPEAPEATEQQDGRFPPIADYAFLSDCEVSALVAPSGNVEWMCLPRHDAPSVFGALLDRAAGRFGFAPYGTSVPAGRRYLPGSLVLETTWQTATGWLIVTDALCVGPWHDVEKRSPRFRRIPRDHEAEAVLLRTARCVKGSVQMLLNCFPVFDYARRNASWEYAGPGYGAAVASAEGSNVELRLTSSLRLGIEGSRAVAVSTLHEGERAFAALTWSDRPPPGDPDEAAAWINGTLTFWREWIADARFPEHRWAPHLRRGALTLKGLTFSPSGALLAASTTSLPEAPGGNRNWDYRYTWIRDSTLMLKALHALGLEREAFDYFGFIGDILAAHPDIQIMYGIDGERQLDEATLDHLSGYAGARPVRTGNGAYNHVQLDVWGAALDSIYIHVQRLDNLPERLWLAVQHLVQSALAHWKDPDRGIWEVRGEPQHFTSSKVMCWVAADRGAKLADLRGEPEIAARWRQAAEEIKKEVLERGVDERGSLVQHYGTKALDASNLMAVMTGFLPPDDARLRATVLAIADELTEDGFVLRYRTDQTDDGLTGKEGTFLICSFWLVSAFVVIGEHARARRLLDKLLSVASPLGLYSEEIEADSGRYLGNFPQAFTHLALIDAVLRVIETESEAGADR